MTEPSHRPMPPLLVGLGASAGGQTLVLEQPEAPLRIEGDEVRLVQAVNNLLANAVRYTPAGGRIAVRLEEQGAWAAVTVADTGAGMSRETLEEAFDVFYRGAGTGAGTDGGLGLGLTLVRRLVELHGGTVEARSDGPGEGSEFVIRLPLTPERRPMPLPRIWRARPPRPGASWSSTTTGTQPEVMLLDIGLPDIDGYTVARELRQREGPQGATLIAVTGFGQENDKALSVAAGIDHHLVKPVDARRLASLLQAAE